MPLHVHCMVHLCSPTSLHGPILTASNRLIGISCAATLCTKRNACVAVWNGRIFISLCSQTIPYGDDPRELCSTLVDLLFFCNSMKNVGDNIDTIQHLYIVPQSLEKHTWVQSGFSWFVDSSAWHNGWALKPMLKLLYKWKIWVFCYERKTQTILDSLVFGRLWLRSTWY